MTIIQFITILVPIIVVVISAVLGPFYLAKRKDQSDLNVSIIQEQTNYRRDLQARIDKLEDRLERASVALNEALDAQRELRSENERCAQEIAKLKTDLDVAQQRLLKRMHDIDGLNGD